MDPTTLVIGGVFLLPLVFGLTQVLKEFFKLDGTKVKIVSLLVTAFFAAIYIIYPSIPAPYNAWITTFILVIAVTLSANGFYQYGERNGG